MIRKILIVSDSHGKNRNVCEAIRREVPDMLIHLGDIENDPGEISRWLDEAASKYNRTNSTKTSDSASSDSHNNYEKSIPIPAIFIQGNCDRYGGNELRKKWYLENYEKRDNLKYNKFIKQGNFEFYHNMQMTEEMINNKEKQNEKE